MHRIYIYILGLMIMGALTACSDELEYGSHEANPGGSKSVEIEVNIVGRLSTREVDEDSKQFFEPGELIHVSATYYCKDKDTPVYQYCAMKFDGKGTWSPLYAENTLSWPDDAVSADFTAYYLYDTNDMFGAQAMQPVLLGDFGLDQDPLLGEAKNVEYGRAVKFDMKHIFTRFIVTQISNNVSNELYFMPERVNADYETNPDTNADIQTEYSTFNNAFLLKLDENGLLCHEFTRVGSDTYRDSNTGQPLVFIKSKTELYLDDDNEMKTRVGFFLQPKIYKKFDLLYPRSRTETATYMNYSEDLSKMTGPEGLEANKFYEFSILKSLGVVVDKNPEDNWDESEPVIILDVEGFIRAAMAGTSYSQKDENSDMEVEILERTLEGSRLLRNVDFQYAYYDIFKDGALLPDMGLGRLFDGNYHYVHNLGCPMFNTNSGTIRNLGIKNDDPEREISLTSTKKYSAEWGSSDNDFSQNGIICRSNIGTLSNLRVINMNIKVGIQTTGNFFEESSQEAHSAAILVGVNSGTIRDLELGGNFKIVVHSSGEIMPRVMLGAIAGQNMGLISGISPIEEENFNPKYSVINKCQGESGSYLVGGVAGRNTGTLSDIMMSSLEVDGTKSRGVVSVTGGLAGSIDESNLSAPVVVGCIVRGNVRAGETRALTNIDSYSYTGGVAGAINIQAYVSESSCAMGVYGTKSYDSAVKYAVGGAFGRIEKTQNVNEGEINTLACFGSALDGLVNIGNFAGISPSDFTWEEKYDGHNINVKQYSGFQNIAAHE